MMTARENHVEEPSGRTEFSDEEIAQRVLAGDGPLFELLMRRYNGRLYRVARAILRDDSEAEDVMQQAYVEAYAHLSQFAGRAKFSTWLTKIAVHEALARVRRRGRLALATSPDDAEEDTMSTLKSTGPDPEQGAMQGELRALLESAIDTLPALYRSVFVFREVEGMSTAETAECLELREDAVKTRLLRAKALLREQLYERAGLASTTVFSFHLSRCDRVVSAVFERLGLGTPPKMH